MIRFFAPGTPVTKGSLIPVLRRRSDGSPYVTLREQMGTALVTWRAVVATQAKRAMKQQMPFTGPLAATLTFYFPRPAADKRHTRVWVAGNKRYDLDKLQRAVFDAMGDAAVYLDDALVARITAEKRYVVGDERPGVVVVLEVL